MLGPLPPGTGVEELRKLIEVGIGLVFSARISFCCATMIAHAVPRTNQKYQLKAR